jgi:polyferredoxin
MTESKEKKPPLTAAQRRKRNIRIRSITRAAIQCVFFIAMPGAFVAGFSGVKYLFQTIGAGEQLAVNSFGKALVGLVLFTILFGRYFCGYVCAFGSLGDFVYWLSGLVQKKLFRRKKQVSLPKKALPWLQKVKYLILAAIIVLCTLGVYGTLSGTSPWEVFSRLSALKGVPSGYLIGTGLLVLILVGMAVQERFFCQFLCPMGAVFSLLPILPWGMLRRKKESCITGCNVCANQCPVGLKLEPDGFRNGECIGCEKCAAACPRGNLTHPEQKLISNPLIPTVIKAVLFFVLGVFLGFCRFL